MAKHPRCYRTVYDKHFKCGRSWLHRLWYKLKIEKRLPSGVWCDHTIRVCSCGRRWKVDRSWVEGTVYVRAKELKGGRNVEAEIAGDV